MLVHGLSSGTSEMCEFFALFNLSSMLSVFSGRYVCPRPCGFYLALFQKTKWNVKKIKQINERIREIILKTTMWKI